MPATRTISTTTRINTRLVQFAPSYFALDLPDGDYRIRFTGDPTTPLLPPSDAPPSFWWSGGEDAADTVLSRTFDLRDVSDGEAILTLRLWYDIEEDWDFAYLLASRNGGLSWEFLTTLAMVSDLESLLGQAFGPGYSGWSEGWIDQEVDLSGYVGEEIVLRLEYVTDGGINLNGIALGGASLPSINYAWTGESGDGGWKAEGYFLSDGVVQQEYKVRLLLVHADGSQEIVPLSLDATLRGEVEIIGLGSSYREAALLVFPLAPATRQPASVAIEIELLP